MSGILCPSCGSALTVVRDSRPRDRMIRRQRECAKCGTKFVTQEVTEADIPSREAIESLREIARRIATEASEILKDE